MVQGKKKYPTSTTLLSGRYLTPSQVARELGLSTRSVQKMLRECQLAGLMIDGQWTISRSSLENYLRLLPSTRQRACRRKPVFGWNSAVWSYEQLLLQQPNVQVGGLYHNGSMFFILIPSLHTSVADDGQNLQGWWKEHKVLGIPIKLVDRLPEGTRRIRERSLRQMLDLTADAFSILDLTCLLELRLPSIFPKVRIGRDVDVMARGARAVEILVSRKLTGQERSILRDSWNRLGTGLAAKLFVVPDLETRPVDIFKYAAPLTLIPARSAAQDCPVSVRSALELDDDFWKDNADVLRGMESGCKVEVLPEVFRKKKSRCLLDAGAFPVRNMRFYLALYEQVVIAMPLREYWGEFLSCAQITEKDLNYLVEQGRVQFVAPHAIARYLPDRVARVLEIRPDAILFSRRLTAATILDGRRRNPLLYPPLDIRGRRQVLRSLGALAERANKEPVVHAAFLSFLDALKQHWSQGEGLASFKGAASSMFSQTATFLAAYFRRLHQKELIIEFGGAMASVEWSAALNAHLFPAESETWSTRPFCEIGASAYSGVPSLTMQHVSIGEIEKVLSGILAPINDAKLSEICQVFDGTSSRRLLGIVQKMAMRAADKEDLQSEILMFNDKVSRFERRREFVQSLDVWGLAGLVGEGYAMAPTALPWALFFLARLETLAVTKGVLGRLLDGYNALTRLKPLDAVFVARVKKALQ